MGPTDLVTHEIGPVGVKLRSAKCWDVATHQKTLRPTKDNAFGSPDCGAE